MDATVITPQSAAVTISTVGLDHAPSSKHSQRRSYARRARAGFVEAYLSGANVLDIGFRGGDPEAVPVTDVAIGVDLDYPGYDGIRLPFMDESQDAILASHVLEHIPNYKEVLRE